MLTKITFKKKSDTEISILMNGKNVGHIWSEGSKEHLPYPHDKDKEYCKNSIQICGFDKCSEVWACGVFHGKKDLVINFIDMSSEFMQSEEGAYRNYVDQFLKSGVEMTKLKTFPDWVAHMGHPDIHTLKKD